MGMIMDRSSLSWFVFGVRPDGSVDIADSEGDVMLGLPAALAQAVLEARDRYLRSLHND